VSFHCDKLCLGECCAPLQWALHVQSLIDRGLPAALSGMSEQQATALYDVSDPAKLAELHAMGLRARGIDADVFPWIPEDGTPWTPRVHIRLAGNGIVRLELPEARTLLLAIMALPADDSSRGACERIVRGES